MSHEEHFKTAYEGGYSAGFSCGFYTALTQVQHFLESFDTEDLTSEQVRKEVSRFIRHKEATL